MDTKPKFFITYWNTLTDNQDDVTDIENLTRARKIARQLVSDGMEHIEINMYAIEVALPNIY